MSFINDDGQFSSDPENLFSSSTVESEHSYTTGKSTKLVFAIGTLLFSNFCPPPPPPLQTIAVYLRVHLGMLQGKVVTHSEEVGWWRTLVVECVRGAVKKNCHKK